MCYEIPITMMSEFISDIYRHANIICKNKESLQEVFKKNVEAKG